MEIQTEITKKEISFIDDIDFRNILYDRLCEIDKVFIVNANYSTIFLSISTIEGIFIHLAKIYKSEIQQSSTYPLTDKGNKKKVDKLAIEQYYNLLKEIDILPKIEDFDKIYKLFRNYRNFIHPQAQTKDKKKEWTVDLGHAQMAIGLLNATLEHLSHNIFIGKEIYQIVAGSPDYDKNKVLHLNIARTRVHSFLINKRSIDKLTLSFELELHSNSVFNFIFNYHNIGSFKMIRLDNRADPKTVNCLLYCTQRYFWREKFFAKAPHPPEKKIFQIQIEIDITNKRFQFIVDGDDYIFNDGNGKKINLFDELKPNLQIGFFNEVGPVKLHNIKLQ